VSRSEVTGGDALISALDAAGVRAIFGVPGIQLDGAIDALARSDSGIEFYSLRHEQAATYMADGYARASGRVGVAMVVPGPGILNATAGLATAYACSSPVFTIVGQVDSQSIGRSLGLLHEIPDQTGVLRGLTKGSYLARTADEVAALVATGIDHAIADRPRPVALEIPVDVLHAPAKTRDLEGLLPIESEEPDHASLERIAHALLAARKPAIYAGGGIHIAGAHGALIRLARLLGAPVVTSLAGAGAIPADDPLALTHACLAAVATEADLIVAVGSRFLDRVGRPELSDVTVAVALINADVQDLGAPRRAAYTARADAGQALELLGDLVSQRGTRPPAWSSHEIAVHRETLSRRGEAVAPQRRWLGAIRAAMPRDSVFVSEMTQMGYVSNDFYPVYRPRGYITPGYQGTLGYGFATALGAQVGAPDSPTVSVTGDGGFGWTLQELSTQAKYQIPLATVIFRDDRFGNVMRIQDALYGGRRFGIDLQNPDFVRLAEAFEVEGARVTSPAELEATLGEAVESRRPIVIEVPVGEMPDPWPIIV